MTPIRLPAEWEPQSGVLLALPHAQSDWSAYLDEALACYAHLFEAISRYEPVVLLVPDVQAASAWLEEIGLLDAPVYPLAIPTNDTWIRDYGPITILEGSRPVLCDFEFNGWGLKFAANEDNQATARLHQSGLFGPVAIKKMGWILEGGSLESDGEGTLLVTTTCLLSLNRHPSLDRELITARLKQDLGADRVLWIENGHLENDDTDAHVDTLVRFCDPHTIAYVGCDDPSDHHYAPLAAMEAELKRFRRSDGEPYRLIRLPMVDPIYYDDERLPATYANFLIINGAVIVPVYGTPCDQAALSALAEAFGDRQIVAVDASVLVRQHGSIHCVTMQLPSSVQLSV